MCWMTTLSFKKNQSTEMMDQDTYDEIYWSKWNILHWIWKIQRYSFSVDLAE